MDDVVYHLISVSCRWRAWCSPAQQAGAILEPWGRTYGNSHAGWLHICDLPLDGQLFFFWKGGSWFLLHHRRSENAETPQHHIIWLVGQCLSFP